MKCECVTSQGKFISNFKRKQKENKNLKNCASKTELQKHNKCAKRMYKFNDTQFDADI